VPRQAQVDAAGKRPTLLLVLLHLLHDDPARRDVGKEL